MGHRHPCGTSKDTAWCGLSPENLRLQQEECIQKNAGCRMMGRREDEELTGGSHSPQGRCWLARRGQVGLEKGERRMAVRRKTWQTQWDAGAGL